MRALDIDVWDFGDIIDKRGGGGGFRAATEGSLDFGQRGRNKGAGEGEGEGEGGMHVPGVRRRRNGGSASLSPRSGGSRFGVRTDPGIGSGNGAGISGGGGGGVVHKGPTCLITEGPQESEFCCYYCCRCPRRRRRVWHVCFVFFFPCVRTDVSISSRCYPSSTPSSSFLGVYTEGRIGREMEVDVENKNKNNRLVIRQLLHSVWAKK